MRRVIVGVAICATALASWTGSARADTTGSAYTDGSGIDQQVGSETTTHGGTGVAVQRCIYVPIPTTPNGSDGYLALPFPGGASVAVTLDPAPGEADGTGGWYAKWCDGTAFYGAFYISNRNPRDLVNEAERYLALPLPVPEMSPANDQVVNLTSWLWIGSQWQALTSIVSVPGVSVTVRAVPESAVWTMGDGAQIVCDGPGSPYDVALADSAQVPGCAYTYSRSSAAQPGLRYQASVTVRWHATWSVAGAPGGGDLGTIDRTTTFAVRVGEVQAINTSTK